MEITNKTINNTNNPITVSGLSSKTAAITMQNVTKPIPNKQPFNSFVLSDISI